LAELHSDPWGEVTRLTGTHSSGRGHHTAYAQFVADGLGIPLESIRFHQGDTDAVSFGRGTGGSRSLPVGGNAVKGAIEKVIAKTKKIAAHKLEAAEADIEFADGVFRIAGTDRHIDFTSVVKDSFEPGNLPPDMESGVDETARYMHKAATFPNGCHVCEVEIDPDTGVTRILRFVVVDDFGAVVNPLLLAGQVHGGIGQGIGQALLEDCLYDPDSGQLVTGSLMDYCMPRADNLPAREFTYNVVPCTTNPLGINCAREGGRSFGCAVAGGRAGGGLWGGAWAGVSDLGVREEPPPVAPTEGRPKSLPFPAFAGPPPDFPVFPEGRAGPEGLPAEPADLFWL